MYDNGCPNCGRQPGLLEFTVHTFVCDECEKVFCSDCIEDDGVVFSNPKCPSCGSTEFSDNY